MDNRKAVLIRLDNNQPYYLDDSMYTIGRSDSCSIVIKDPTLSREHARIWWENGNWYLEDSNSANGVELNSVLLEPGRAYILPLGCTILLSATYEFRFGWGPEYDNRTISVPHPEQYANSPAGGSNSKPNESDSPKGGRSDVGNDNPQRDSKTIKWDDDDLRKRGKEDAKKIGRSGVWAALIYGFIVGIPVAFSIFHFNYAIMNDFSSPVYSIFMIVYVLLLIFVFNPLIVGIRRFFYKGIRNVQPLSEITWGFHNNYKGIVLTMFYRDIFLFLGTIILSIVGILLFGLLIYGFAFVEDSGSVFSSIIEAEGVAAAYINGFIFALGLVPFYICASQLYSVSMVPYILGKDPTVTGIRVLKLSGLMTKGYRRSMLHLGLKLSGMGIISIITLGQKKSSDICCTKAEIFNLLLD